MATTSTKLPVSSSGGPMFQGWVQKGRKGQIGFPYHAREEEKEIVGPTKPMKQIGKRKSEKGKLRISSPPDQLTRGKTVWHITPPDSRDPLKPVSKTLGQSSGSNLIAKTNASPTRQLSSIPPPPSNPPPILDRAKLSDSKEEIKESEATKLAQANAAKSTAPTAAKESANMLTGHGAVKQSLAGGREGVEGRGGRVGGAERKSPPKHPPPQSTKAKAAAVVTMAIQDHVQSSTRSAPGKLQSAVKMEEGVPEGGREGGRESTRRMRTESAGNKLVVGGRNADKGNKPSLHPSIRPEIAAVTSSGGGVKNLARFFSGRSKENTSTAVGSNRDASTADSPIRSPIPRGLALEEKGDKITDKSVPPSGDGRMPSEMRGHMTGTQSKATTSGSSPDADNDYQQRKLRKRSFSGSKHRQPLSIPSLDEEPEERYERLMSITSSVSNSSPTHTTPSSWCSRSYHNVFSDPAFARFDKRDPTLNLSPSSPTVPFSANSVTHNYQNVFDNENFARFNKTETADKGKKEEGGEVNPMNGKTRVDTQGLMEDERGDSDREGSRKEKKPKPLPRKSSQDTLGSLSNSEASLSTLSPLAATEDPAGVYEDMQSHVTSKLDPLAEEKLKVEVQGLQTEEKGGKLETERRGKSSGTAQPPDQPEMVVLGAQDPEWMENYQKLIEQEIDMLGEFDDDFSFQLSLTPWNRESAILDGNETRVAQEGEEKIKGEGDGGDEMMATARKASLAKAVSHSPQGTNIHRRNTPKEKRELRQGICSADDRLDSRRDSDLDDYIPMNPVRLSASSQTVSLTPAPLPSHSALSQPKPKSQPSFPSQSLLVPGPPPGMDPRSSTYYLKIIPYDTPTPSSQAASSTQPSSSAAETTTAQGQLPVKHQYIDIDIPDEPTEVFVPFQGKVQEGKHRKESTQAESGTGGSPSTLSTRRKLKYSQVEVVPGKSRQNKIIEDRVAGPRGITKYSQVKVGADTASEPPADESSSPKLKRSQGSVFAKEMMKYINRPLPPTPEGNIYYKTITHPLPHVPPMRTPVWHEYVEIDEDELNQKKGNVSAGSPGAKRNLAKNGGIAALKTGGKEAVASGNNEKGSKEKKTHSRSATPPPVPARSSCPYVEIDGEDIQEMAKSLPSSSILATLKQNNKALSPSLPNSEDNNATAKDQSHLNSPPRMARKMGPPPEIPKRPEVFSRERSFSSSGEYSYAMVPGLKFQWLKMQPRHEDGQGYFINAVPGSSSHPGRNPSLHAKKNLMATISEVGKQEKRASDHPPSVPPKTESLLREQGLLLANYGQKPSPYLVPIKSKKRKMSSPEIFNLSTFATSAGPPAPRSPKEIVSDMRRELLLEEDQRRGGKGASSGSDRGSSSPEHSKAWKLSTPPPRPPPPKLTPNTRREQSPGSMSNSDRWDQSPKNGRKQSGEENKISNTAGGNFKSSPARLTPEYREEATASMSQGYNREGEEATGAEVSPEFLRARKSGLQQYINRSSLALIMQNKEAIERQLKKERGEKVEEGRKIQKENNDDGERVKQSSSSTSQAAGVRGLGEILLEVDSLLQQRVCSEEDLIAAMEEQLKIKLQPVKQGSRERGKEQDVTQEEGREECGISIQITQEDVDEVVSFMNENQPRHNHEETEGGEENVPTAEGTEMTDLAETERNSVLVKSDYDLQDLPFSPKQRSSTFVIIDDADLPARSQQWRRRKAANSTENDSSLALRFGGAGPRTGMIPEGDLVGSLDQERIRSGQKRFGAEGDFAMSPEENMRDSRSFSLGPKPLRRVNARRRTNPASDMHSISPAAKHFTQGTGIFTSKGGTLTNLTSEVEIEIPEGAVPRGKKQKLWFEVVHTVYDPLEEEGGTHVASLSELSDSTSSLVEVENFLSERKERTVQLSSMVLVGPHDAKLEQPLKLKIPHCLPYRNNSWHLHLQARAQNCESNDWVELSNSSGLIISPSQQRQKFFKDSSYQMHLRYAVVKTKEMGWFKLRGSPMRSGSHSAKRMVASIFSKLDDSGKTWSLPVILNNAIQDQIQALDLSMHKASYYCLEHSLPVTCFGDGRDLELALYTENNSLPLATQVIPFGQFWRMKTVGQARVFFSVSSDQLVSSEAKTLTLKIQQAGSKLLHETNFVLAA